MAEENAPATPPAKGSSTKTTLIIVVVVALLEGGAFFGAMKFFGGGPAPSYGAEDHHAIEGPPPPPPEKASAEVVLLKNFRVPNIKSGRTIVYDFDVSVAVPEDRKTEIEELAKNREAEIRDRVFQIIRQARPAVLEEDDFATLRMLLKRALGDIVGDAELIQRVLIPHCLPLPGD